MLSRFFYYAHIIDEETEAQQDPITSEGHEASGGRIEMKIWAV